MSVKNKNIYTVLECDEEGSEQGSEEGSEEGCEDGSEQNSEDCWRCQGNLEKLSS